jgi:glycosyltransferase involved in cell wall biosynthesis
MMDQDTGASGAGAAPARAAEQMRLAYLVSEYPRISHTFILREVRRLRALGLEIATASINRPDRPLERLTAEERAEAAATFMVKPAGVSGALRAHLAALVRRPLRYLSGMLFALRLGGADLRKIVFGLFYFVEAVMVGEWMRAANLRHLHVHFATPASTVGLIAARIYPIGWSLTVHGPDEFYDAPGYCLAQKIAGASFVCCIGMYARSQLMKLSPPAQWSKFEVAPLGVLVDEFAPRPAPPPSDCFEILCVGRLVAAKGQHILLAAVERLTREGRRVRLRLAGDGPDGDALQADARRRALGDAVVFEGAVNPDRIREIYASADLFALASFAEGIPVVLMEAMAMEIPCVATFITGIPELIRDGVDGLLVAPSDDAALARAIARLMDDAELRHRLARAGRRRVVECYDLERNSARLAEIFRRRLEAHA